MRKRTSPQPPEVVEELEGELEVVEDIELEGELEVVEELEGELVDWRCIPAPVRAICLIEHTRANIQRVMRYNHSMSFAGEDGISRRYRVAGVDRGKPDSPVKLIIGYPAMKGRMAEIVANRAGRAQWTEDANIKAHKQRMEQLQSRLAAEQADWKSRGLEYPPQQTQAYNATMANIALTIESCQKRSAAFAAELEVAKVVAESDQPSQVVCWVYPERQVCYFVN